MSQPLCFDLFAGLGGWTEAFLSEGYRVVGFDIKRHVYGEQRYPGQLVIQNVLTLHGSQFRDAAVIVASPPCQKYSYMAMPWKRAKAMAAWYREKPERQETLNALLNACFRIQREAIEATGKPCLACDGLGPRHPGHICPRCNGTCWVTRHIPLIVENVRGAQPWVGRARWHYGSFYLWGDVPALMPSTLQVLKRNPDGTDHGQGSWFAIADSKNRGSGQKVPGFNFHQHEKNGKGGSFQSAAVDAIKNNGGSWFAQAHNTESGHSRNPVTGEDGTKVPGIKLSEVGFNVAAAQRYRADSFGSSKDSPLRNNNSRSDSRKAASAQIAKIPFPLAQHIARVFHSANAVNPQATKIAQESANI